MSVRRRAVVAAGLVAIGALGENVLRVLATALPPA